MKRKATLCEHRRRLILERLQKQGALRTVEFTKVFSVSPMTVRNDLNAKAKQGYLRRVQGGAVPAQGLMSEPSYQEKASQNVEEKRRIGHLAAKLIEPEMAVFIGNGTTTMAIVQALREMPPNRFTAFTNALTHAAALAEIPLVTLFVIGGYLRGVSYAMVGPLARQALAAMHFDLAFLGASGISAESGITLPSLEEAETAAEVVRHAEKVFLLADHTKFNVVTHSKIVDMQDVDVLVTDEPLPHPLTRSAQVLGIEVYLATKGGDLEG